MLNSKPYSESLIDLHQEHCRPNSKATLMCTIRTVEQGMGRSVRGEKDYSIIVVVGSDLVRLMPERRPGNTCHRRWRRKSRLAWKSLAW